MRRLPPPRRHVGLLCLLLGIFFHSPSAQAYPWMIKHGFFKCGSCHTDPSGGETLTEMGRYEAQHLLSMNGDPNGELHAYSEFSFGTPQPDALRLGGSYRHMLVYTASNGSTPSQTSTFPMQLDVYGSGKLGMFVFGGSVGVAHGIVGSANVRGAQINKELGEGWLVLSRTHFIGFQLDPQTLIRAGRLNLPFGLRIPEHVLWVRAATRTDRESDQQHGLALAYNEGRFRGELMAVAGNYQIYPDRYRERGYAASAEFLAGPTNAFGVSSLVTFANEDRFTQTRRAVRHAHGVNGRFGMSPELAILAEVDALKDAGRNWGATGLVQLDDEPVRGLHWMLTGEVLDQGAPEKGPPSLGNGEPKVGAWISLDWHFLSHFEARVDFVKRQETPISLQAQFHWFL
jgi:hypothetical protein